MTPDDIKKLQDIKCNVDCAYEMLTILEDYRTAKEQLEQAQDELAALLGIEDGNE